MNKDWRTEFREFTKQYKTDNGEAKYFAAADFILAVIPFIESIEREARADERGRIEQIAKADNEEIRILKNLAAKEALEKLRMSINGLPVKENCDILKKRILALIDRESI